MMFDALTNAGKHATCMLNFACACCQRYTKDSVFWIDNNVHYDVRQLPLFVGPNVIANAPQTGCLYVNYQQACYLRDCIPGKREPNMLVAPTEPLRNLAASAPGAALYRRPLVFRPETGFVLISQSIYSFRVFIIKLYMYIERYINGDNNIVRYNRCDNQSIVVIPSTSY